jgi:hypothetical protein
MIATEGVSRLLGDSLRRRQAKAAALAEEDADIAPDGDRAGGAEVEIEIEDGGDESGDETAEVEADTMPATPSGEHEEPPPGARARRAEHRNIDRRQSTGPSVQCHRVLFHLCSPLERT